MCGIERAEEQASKRERERVEVGKNNPENKINLFGFVFSCSSGRTAWNCCIFIFYLHGIYIKKLYLFVCHV